MSIEISQPEQQLSSEQKPIDTTSSPDIGNTNVVGRQSQPSIEVPLEFKLECLKMAKDMSGNVAAIKATYLELVALFG